jgi:hypothetical protein
MPKRAQTGASALLKPFFAAIAALAAALSLTTSAAAQGSAAAAAPQRRFEATYTVIARGVQAGEFTYHFTQTGNTYEASAERRITGIWRAAAGSSQDYSYSVRGTVAANGALRPTSYRHQGGRRNRVVESRFTASDIVTTTNPPGMGMGDPPATQAQKRGAVDQITAIAAMVVATGDPCSRTINVYMDGRSRFDFVMSPNGRVNARGRAFNGSVYRCNVDFVPIAGFSDPQERSTLEFLFAPTDQGMFAPVRIEMPTDDGIVVLDARSLTVNGVRLR